MDATGLFFRACNLLKKRSLSLNMLSFSRFRHHKKRIGPTDVGRYPQNVCVPSLEPDVVTYPPIKPPYPPGKWGDMSKPSAWLLHKEAEDLLSIPKVKERLEEQARVLKPEDLLEKGKLLIMPLPTVDPRYLWQIEAVDTRPNSVAFRQFITRTHIVREAVSDSALCLSSVDVSAALERLRPSVNDCILQELEYQHRRKVETRLPDDIEQFDVKKYTTHRLLGAIVNVMLAELGASNPHLLRCHLDENVRVETFWEAAGFAGEDIPVRGQREDMTNKDGSDPGMLTFQYKHVADWQIRPELPAPQFAAIDNAVCIESFVPLAHYSPSGIGLTSVEGRPITMSGHWVGDPCEFTAVSMHVLPSVAYDNLSRLGDRYAIESMLSCGLLTGFGSCFAQAYNQGFSRLHELTYPITTQCIVANGNQLQAFAYQLNTTLIWKDWKANNLRNVLWTGPVLTLFDRVESGKVKGLNDDAIKSILRCLLSKPVDRGVNLRPYLPEEEAPIKKTLYINLKGTEPLPYTKIGQFQYKKDSLYFK